jgi:hypothetical protein
MKTIWRIGLATMGVVALAAVLTAQARPRPEVSLLGEFACSFNSAASAPRSSATRR